MFKTNILFTSDRFMLLSSYIIYVTYHVNCWYVST